MECRVREARVGKSSSMGVIMRVEVHHMYRKYLPEEFPWHRVNEVSVRLIAALIVTAIQQESRTRTRVQISGLREALQIVAEVATVE